MNFSEVDIKVIRGIREAVDVRGVGWRYPNGWVDGERVAPVESLDPDWVEQPSGQCVNLLPDGSGACIIGCAAVNAGLPTERASGAGIDAHTWGVGDAVADAMAVAQTAQDNGFTWGVAWNQFVETLVGYGFTEQQIGEVLG